MTAFLVAVTPRSDKEIIAENEVEIGGSSQTVPGNLQRAIYIYQLKQWLSTEAVQGMLQASANSSGTVFYSMDTVKEFTASAPGIDLRHHIVSSYLVGYVPFETKNIWVPWLTLSRRKMYQTDKITYKGRKDVWQNSKQAYTLPRGDCEDHALSLADWLISMGQDARVVLGTYKGTGHAWVILFREGKEYLLEATQKTGFNQMKSLPLASYYPDYRPMYMFNRKCFWKNYGSSLTTRYNSSDWKKKSIYSL